MQLFYKENLIDLAPHGLFAITSNDTHQFPLPAHELAYAHWHDDKNVRLDRTAVCTLRLKQSILHDCMKSYREQTKHYRTSATQTLDWCEKKIGDEYNVAPTSVSSLGNGLLFLVFAHHFCPAIFRVVDVYKNEIIYEESASSLCAHLNIDLSSEYAKTSIDQPSIMAVGAGHVDLYLASHRVLLKFDKTQFVLTDLLKKRNTNGLTFSAKHLFYRNSDDNEYQITPLESGGPSHIYHPKYNKNAYSDVSAAAGTERFALAHKGGLIEILDDNAISLHVFRSDPRAPSNVQLAISLTYSGRYLYAAGGEKNHVVDIEKKQIADFDFSLQEAISKINLPDLTIEYRGNVLVTDQGIFTLCAEALSFLGFADLDWLPVMETGYTNRNKVDTQAQQTFQNLLLRVKKSGLELGIVHPGNPSVSEHQMKSFMYGVPKINGKLNWPEFEEQPMLLLCQIDLAEVSTLLDENPFPTHGQLLFFVSTDEDGELIDDGTFEPAATCVIWVQDMANSSSSGTTDFSDKLAAPVQALQFNNSAFVWPQADSCIVQSLQLLDDDLQDYFAFLENTQPEDVSHEHRLGGYPTILQNNDLEAQAECVRNGHYPGSGSEDLMQASRWRLLLQLNSDSVFMWGTDSGILYFMIHDDDLRKGDFSKVVCTSVGC